MNILVFGLLASFFVASYAAEKNVVCYVGTWATYRHSNGKYDVENIDPHLCTHLIYAFFGIEYSGDFRVIDPYLDLEENWGRGNVKKFNNLKNINPKLKTLAAVGGWNEGSHKFSEVAKSPEKRRVFIKTALDFVLKHNFDGLDLDWEYPARRDGDPKVDKENHVIFLRELKEEFSKHGLLLTAAVSSTETSSSISYNIPEISKYLDLINVMCYDLHGSWDKIIGVNAPLYASPADKTPEQRELNVNSSIQFWLNAGAPAEKLVLGLPAYGRTFTLDNPADTSIGATNNGPGLPGKYTNEPGFTGFNEICEKQQQEQWTVVWDEDQKVPYMYKGNQWVGYDDVKSVQYKAEYANLNNLGGIMVWSLETDDFLGLCGHGKYPLMKKINEVIREGTIHPEPEPTTTESQEHESSSSLPEVTSTENPETPTTTESEGHESSSSEPEVTSTENPGNVFQCHKSGVFADPNDCTIFHICQGVVKYTFDCPKGLLFDKIILTCNWPYLVDC